MKHDAMDGADRMAQYREDFDRIAGVSRDGADRNTLYHGQLLAHVPERCKRALDVGCGAGALTRQLAARSGHVLGVDLSPKMLDRAREASAGISSLTRSLVRGLRSFLNQAI